MDQAFPPHTGAGTRALVVELHHNEQLACVLLTCSEKPRRVLHRRFGVVDRVRAGQHKQPVGRAMQHGGDVAPGLQDQLLQLWRRWHFLQDARGRKQWPDRGDAQVVCRGCGAELCEESRLCGAHTVCPHELGRLGEGASLAYGEREGLNEAGSGGPLDACGRDALPWLERLG